MRFSFVFAAGRIQLDEGIVEADGRLYHLDLPRAARPTQRVAGTVAGTTISIPMIDVLGAVRDLHPEKAGWLNSGARAHLTGASSHFDHADGRPFLDRVRSAIDADELLDSSWLLKEIGSAITPRWLAAAPHRDNPHRTINREFSQRREAELWLQRRAFADGLRWTYGRTDELIDDETTSSTLDEVLDVALFFSQPPSSMLAVAGVSR